MSETKFTKGEWKVDYDNDSSCEWYYTGPAKVEYSYNSTGNEETEALANAHLIAAAPEMYDMLNLIFNSCHLNADGTADVDIIKLKELLAKARGEK